MKENKRETTDYGTTDYGTTDHMTTDHKTTDHKTTDQGTPAPNHHRWTQMNTDPAANQFLLSASCFQPAASRLRAFAVNLCFLLSAFCFLLSAWAADAPKATPTNAPAPPLAPAATNLTVAVPATMDALDEKYHLAIGDRLSFRIEEDEEEPRSLTVTDSGDLEVPYIGRFPAENKTCKQLAQQLKKALEREYYYDATVILAVDSMTRSRGKVYLVGPVRVPGAMDIPSDEVLTLSKAIMRAGGFNDFADRRNVKVTRKAGPGEADNKTFVVDVAAILEKGKTDRDIPLEPGDLVLIPERLIRF
jgi:polysaccharide biosynthesis/export protein